VTGFIALILNPFVVFVQRRVRRRGPLANGLTHLSHRLPGRRRN
jgi:hypothetical protein